MYVFKVRSYSMLPVEIANVEIFYFMCDNMVCFPKSTHILMYVRNKLQLINILCFKYT